MWEDVNGEIVGSDGGQANVSFSDVEGGYPGDGNIDADPLFENVDLANLHLEAGSPCIDSGDGDTASDTDMENNARVDDPDTPNMGVGDPSYCDMGAFEHLP